MGMSAARARAEAARVFAVVLRDRVKAQYAGRGGLTRAARDMDIGYSRLWNFCRGHLMPGERVLRRICDALKWPYKEAVRMYPQGYPPGRGGTPGTARPKWERGSRLMGELLVRWREESGMHPREVAAGAGISFTYFIGLRKGRVGPPSFAVGTRLAAAMGKKPWKLIALRLAYVAPEQYRDRVLDRLLPGLDKDLGGRI